MLSVSPTDPITIRPPARRGRRRRLAISGMVAAFVAAGAAGVVTTTAQAAPAVSVSVDAGTALGTVPATGVGMNTAVYDSNMTDPAAASLLKAAGIQQLRYPGGSVGDAYHWKTSTLAPGAGSYVAPNTDFDHFMAMAKTVGAQPILIANYGSGSPQEAADWVKYANVTIAGAPSPRARRSSCSSAPPTATRPAGSMPTASTSPGTPPATSASAWASTSASASTSPAWRPRPC